MDLFNYVMQTPANTNPAVLSSEIQKLIDENTVQADYNQTDTDAKDYIKNKPCYYTPSFYGTFFKEVELVDKEPNSIHLLIDGTAQYSPLEDFTFDSVKEFTLPSHESQLIGCVVEFTIKSTGHTSTAQYPIGVSPRRENILALDSVNYYGELPWGILYFILDTTALTEANKANFPHAGLWVKRKKASAFSQYASFKVRGCAYSNIRLREIVLPVNTQGKAISDSNDYFSEKTVEGALDQIGSQLSSKELILNSSTPGSSKKFKVTVDDSGTLSATEITASTSA